MESKIKKSVKSDPKIKKNEFEHGSKSNEKLSVLDYHDEYFFTLCPDQQTSYLASYAKRKKHREQETQFAVQRMRKALPVYKLEEIRNFRLPLHEALIINLQEKGFHSTAAYIKELIDHQEEITSDWVLNDGLLLPKLKSNKAQLTVLAEGLKTAETFHNQQQFEQECEVFLQLAIHFAFGNYDWWWMGSEMLVQSIQVSSQYTSLNGKYEALSRYVYARYLGEWTSSIRGNCCQYNEQKNTEKVEMVKEYTSAIIQLKIASSLSNGEKWTCKNLLPVRGTLYIQINELLYECFIEQTKRLIANFDYQGAVKMASKAQISAATACIKNYESKALLLKGICEIHLNYGKEAMNSLLKAYSLEKRHGTIEGMCEIRIQMVLAAMVEDRIDQALSILMELKKDTEEYDLPFYLAQTYKYLGSYLLTIGKPGRAYQALKEASKVLSEAAIQTKDVDEVRNLKAIAFGLLVFPNYVDILLEAETKKADFENIMKLVRWKDDRVEFWDDMVCVICSGPIGQYISESITNIQEQYKIDYMRAKYYMSNF